MPEKAAVISSLVMSCPLEGSELLGLWVEYRWLPGFFLLLYFFLFLEERPKAQANVTCTELHGPWMWLVSLKPETRGPISPSRGRADEHAQLASSRLLLRNLVASSATRWWSAREWIAFRIPLQRLILKSQWKPKESPEGDDSTPPPFHYAPCLQPALLPYPLPTLLSTHPPFLSLLLQQQQDSLGYIFFFPQLFPTSPWVLRASSVLVATSCRFLVADWKKKKRQYLWSALGICQRGPR